MSQVSEALALPEAERVPLVIRLPYPDLECAAAGSPGVAVTFTSAVVDQFGYPGAVTASSPRLTPDSAHALADQPLAGWWVESQSRPWRGGPVTRAYRVWAAGFIEAEAMAALEAAIASIRGGRPGVSDLAGFAPAPASPRP